MTTRWLLAAAALLTACGGSLDATPAQASPDAAAGDVVAPLGDARGDVAVADAGAQADAGDVSAAAQCVPVGSSCGAGSVCCGGGSCAVWDGGEQACR